MNPAQYPLYLEKLDERQRTAAMAERNCVVTAGAGAGKTTVLASRYIHLVVEKKLPVRSILALTFTRKAAAEMYERIYGELAAQTSPGAREQLDEFQNNHITTLDAFCAEIVRQAARDFGYSPEFKIDAEKSADLARSIAYRYVLRNRDKPGIREILKSFPFDEVAARLFGDLGSRYITPLALAEKQFSLMKDSLRTMAAEKADAAFKRLAAMAKDIVALSTGAPAPRADCASAVACSLAFIEAIGRSPSTAPALSFFSRHFDAFTELAMRSYGRSEAEQSIKAIAKEAREEARNLLDFAEYQTAFPSHCSLFDRLDEFASEVAEAKRLADLMDFKDLGACAVHALKRRKDIRAYWKGAIESIMIDEFQDNNELQKNLLYLLAEKRENASDGIPSPEELEPGKLFFVGDEKQSIYRFRGADVAVFKRLSRELSEDLSGDIVLSANYRSSPPLIGFFNDFFAFVMSEGSKDDMSKSDETQRSPNDFHARYANMEPGRPQTKPQAQADSSGARIEYFLLPAAEEDKETSEETQDPSDDPIEGRSGSEPLGADDSLAFEIAQFIKRSRGTMELRPAKDSASEDEARMADYGDFAVLLRTTTNQHRLEKYLRLLDIPFDSESPRSLFRESPANDIYSILSYALDPGDNAAYAAVLRSPLCGVSDQAFLELMTSAGAAFELEASSDHDSAMLDRAKAFFAEFRTSIVSNPVSDIVEYVWNRGGLRLAILSRPESHPFLEHFDYLFHMAAGIDREHGGIADFLAKLRPYIEGETDKFDIENVPRSNASGVKILTIHKSKGLQFPVVILPWAENSGSTKRGQAIWEMLPEGLALDIKPYDKPGAKANNIFFRLAKNLENDMSVAEIKRLLYVACTRAEDHLFFFGKRQKRGDTAGNSFLYYLENYCAMRDSRDQDRSGTAIEAQASARLKKTLLAPRTVDDVRHWYKGRVKPSLSDFAQAYCEAKILGKSFSRRHLKATELERPQREIRTSQPAGIPAPAYAHAPATALAAPGDQSPLPPKIFGTLCHDAVEQAIKTGTVSGFAPSKDLVHDLSPSNIARATELATSMAVDFLSSDFWKSLPAGAEMTSEKPFLLKLGDFIVEGRMDLLIETGDEVTVIDFKSDSEEAPSRHAVQLDIYRRAAENIIPGKKTRIGLYWLRSSSLTWMDSAISDEDLLHLAHQASLGIGQEHA